MAIVSPVESSLTDRYQTTVPEPVRRALKLRKRDKIQYVVRPNGEVVLTRAPDADAPDPAVQAFLQFLAADVVQHPEQLQAVGADLRARIMERVGDVKVDLDAALSDDDE